MPDSVLKGTLAPRHELSQPACREVARDAVNDAATFLASSGGYDGLRRDCGSAHAPQPGTKATVRMKDAAGRLLYITVEVVADQKGDKLNWA